jgi:hypothetical protein
MLPAVAELATVIWLLVFGIKHAAKGKPAKGKLTPVTT